MADPKKTPAAAGTAKADATTKTPRQRFLEVGAPRVAKAIKALRALKNISVRKSYEYTDADTSKMFGALDAEMSAVRKTFEAAMAGKTGAKGDNDFAF